VDVPSAQAPGEIGLARGGWTHKDHPGCVRHGGPLSRTGALRCKGARR
jgi:hypothetical protein